MPGRAVQPGHSDVGGDNFDPLGLWLWLRLWLWWWWRWGEQYNLVIHSNNVGDDDVCTNQWMPMIMRRLVVVLVMVAVITMIDQDHDDRDHDDNYVPTWASPAIIAAPLSEGRPGLEQLLWGNFWDGNKRRFDDGCCCVEVINLWNFRNIVVKYQFWGEVEGFFLNESVYSNYQLDSGC